MAPAGRALGRAEPRDAAQPRKQKVYARRLTVKKLIPAVQELGRWNHSPGRSAGPAAIDVSRRRPEADDPAGKPIMPPQPWFAPKRFGYGARPIAWQGWALTSSFVLLVAVVVSILPDPWRWLVVVPLTAAFVALCRARTSAPWRWRWGRE
jgi:hypothetical protein